MAEISSDVKVVELELTKEILTELGISELIKPKSGSSYQKPSDRIEAYAKCFRQLWKVLREPGKE